MISRGPSGPTVPVTFELPAAVGATTVTVCGDFNEWSHTSHPLTRLRDGSFRTVIDLAAGRRWHFRYLLDGMRWENDWAADDYAPNIYGGQDSVIDLSGASDTDTPGAVASGVDGSGTADGDGR
jgi:1,4-alpha-glucan branching enzyme